MKPKPLASLNHLTVPCSMCFSISLKVESRVGESEGNRQKSLETKEGWLLDAPFEHTQLHCTTFLPRVGRQYSVKGILNCARMFLWLEQAFEAQLRFSSVSHPSC